MMQKLQDLVRQHFGKVGEEEQKEVYSDIDKGSHPTPDYFVMLVISAVIATIGLLTNSVAAIIGAMLVSPLLLPVIGISLGAVKGDMKLFRSAIEAEAKGIAIVLVLVVVLALMVPNASVTTEIQLRTHPTPLDLVVALASGAAGAYALCRKNIGAALPGVAIAVAIMPPLCVVGIGISLKLPAIAAGGALMFLANVVAINFAAIAVFWLLGFAPQFTLDASRHMKEQLKNSAILLLIISLPLAWIMWDSVSSSGIRSTVERVVSAQLDGIPQAALVAQGFSYNKDGSLSVVVSIDSPREITQAKADEMRLALEKNLGTHVELSLKVNQIRLVQSSSSD